MHVAGNDVANQPMCDGCMSLVGGTAFLLSVFACRCAAVLYVLLSTDKPGVYAPCCGQGAMSNA